jgi:hypothetical protein
MSEKTIPRYCPFNKDSHGRNFIQNGYGETIIYVLQLPLFAKYISGKKINLRVFSRNETGFLLKTVYVRW